MNLLETINAQAITSADLMGVVEDVAEHHGEPDMFEVAAFCVAARCENDPQKAGAMFMRMQALAKFVGTINPRGWTLPKQADGSIPTQEAVFAAAAIHPLVKVGEQLEFEPESFAARILECAEAEGKA